MSRITEKVQQWLVGILVVLAAAVFILDLLTPLGVAVGVLYAALVLLSLWSPWPRLPLMVALGCTMLTILGFFLSASSGILWMAIANRGLALLSIWIIASLCLLHTRADRERDRLIRELTDALEQVQTLRGLLPTCASCKKVRDDKGYWNRLELYVEAHSQALFTHTLCPECEKKWFPELANSE